jgi:hypothetical protein
MNLDDAFYQQDIVRVMSLITARLAADLGAKVDPHEQAHDQAVRILAELDAVGHRPADLAAKTDEYVQDVRDTCVAAVENAEARLALPPSLLEALGIDAAAEKATKDQAAAWLAAIDAVWKPGGGG